MRWAPAIVLTSLGWLCATVAAEAQTLQLELVASLEGQVSVVGAAGNLACMADGPTLTVVDLTDPARPTKRGTVTLPDRVWEVEVVGTRAYVSAGHAGLQILDIAGTAGPKIVGSYESPGQVAATAVSGSTAVVVNNMTGLEVVDVADAERPTLTGSYLTPGFPRDIAAIGTVAYVADQPSGLEVVDFSRPSAPEGVSLHESAEGTAQTVEVSIPTDRRRAAPRTYILDGRTGLLEILDVSDPRRPSQIGAFETPGRTRSVAVRDSVAFLGDPSSGVRVVDLSDPSAPVPLGSYETPGGARDVAITESLVLVAGGPEGLTVLRRVR